MHALMSGAEEMDPKLRSADGGRAAPHSRDITPVTAACLTTLTPVCCKWVVFALILPGAHRTESVTSRPLLTRKNSQLLSPYASPAPPSDLAQAESPVSATKVLPPAFILVLPVARLAVTNSAV